METGIGGMAMTEADGWVIVRSGALAAWAKAAARWVRASGVLSGSADWRSGGTWFVGVDHLANGPDGAVPLGPPFPWQDLPLAPVPLHRAQVSIVRPGYPRPDPGETDAAFGYRLRRDAAHLDGLLAVGADRRRMVREPHAWVLGIGLWGGARGAAPTVIWPGSHRIAGPALAAALAAVPAGVRGQTDVTDAYVAARRAAFHDCPRLEVPLKPGEALLLHRHLLHGVAPWSAKAAPDRTRAVAWFRPLLKDVSEWLG